ncbi:MAG: arginine--tRNA ligase [Candidatus Bathyarchaeota archaeon]|uniref:arginine--tRNA ligase n=1 Tax=Candidatus Bathycorpusculum sp. TaxID=2994959 RepID=UPI002836C57F|nr:arginine--tRNA ligase [Candidatus Termiticorpusculum sp.]MCL2258179.1 arginine--tRNA ligase [Candidatus Termiticorpusculum sp.]MCL2291494.1 arginine--tRNA ligase [Candidatus Termiticorpusculum sp.]
MENRTLRENPFDLFRQECRAVLAQALTKAFPEVSSSFIINLNKTPLLELGQLASSISFELAKKLDFKPLVVAEKLVESIDKSQFDLIEKVSTAGVGYINFYVNFPKFSQLTLKVIKDKNTNYGYIKTENPAKIIVEHTSVNPLHPIHIGQARNPIIGDTLASILRLRGHDISTHYYIDDVGRQSSVVAYGYQKLGKPRSAEKPDLFVGEIYTVTCCIVEIDRLKKAKNKIDSAVTVDDVKIAQELDEWLTIAVELKEKYPVLFEDLMGRISKDENPEEEINSLNRRYEAGEPVARQLIREVSDLCLDGFRQTQSRVSVFYDSWDWESDFVWSGQVTKAVTQLQASPFLYFENNVWAFNADKAANFLKLKSKLGLKENHEIPSLTLMRADGTTLYTTRDVAYSIWKFQRAEKVINVIGMEQSLAQLQLKLALYALGYSKEADNFTHFAYNLVALPGYKMSSRRGHYITFDQVLDEAIERAYQEVCKRSPMFSEEEKRDIAKFVGIGAVRYALIDVDPSKQVLFTWDRVLNFETNSAPYVQYTHARACSILRKATDIPRVPVAYNLLTEKLEQELILQLSSFPDMFIEAAEYLKPAAIADYANTLADKFNTFYGALPVIKAETPELCSARIALTDAIRTVLSNALSLIGVVAPERM